MSVEYFTDGKKETTSHHPKKKRAPPTHNMPLFFIDTTEKKTQEILSDNGQELRDPYCAFIHKSRYAKFLPEEGRRETWLETVMRYVDYMFGPEVLEKQEVRERLSHQYKNRVLKAILLQEIMPSMRALMTAGSALTRDNVCGYNCAYAAINKLRRFSEILYILMCGTGVGFSCEKEVIQHLPHVPASLQDVDNDVVHIVHDSRKGWAEAFEELIRSAFDETTPGFTAFDFSCVRPKGAKLKTMGGRASGPQPLMTLFGYMRKVLLAARGRMLTSLEVHLLVCKIASVVVVGGVRRSALISLSDLNDKEMRDAKSGEWWVNNPELSNSNNSAVYEGRPDVDEFIREWRALAESGSGERGIFNRQACVAKSRAIGRCNEKDLHYGTNPCSEIILEDAEFCNLTEVVCRPDDTEVDLRRKVILATVLGVLQSSLVEFDYLGPEWNENCSAERLLGVSLTGIMDNPLLYDIKTNESKEALELMLSRLLGHANVEAIYTSRALGIQSSAAITCVKPSGTVSQLVKCSSGIHPAWNQHYVRRVRCDEKDPIVDFLHSCGLVSHPEVQNSGTSRVFAFPIVQKGNPVTRNHMSAIEQLDLWLVYYKKWCEHKPSMTVYVGDDEWDTVRSWVWKNFDDISGVSFLPRSGGSYRLMPYEDVSVDLYELLLAYMPKEIDWDRLANFEKSDTFRGNGTSFACTGDACEMVDIALT